MKVTLCQNKSLERERKIEFIISLHNLHPQTHREQETNINLSVANTVVRIILSCVLGHMSTHMEVH